jgi:deoxycytidine triphosphate deaminase
VTGELEPQPPAADTPGFSARQPDCDPPHDPNRYWTKPVEDLPREYWIAGNDHRPGLLSADRIRYYALKLGMIDPYCDANLKPASYSLTLGPLFQVEGENGVLTPDSPTITIPPNNMAFVSMREALRLPHYIAARFNLSIELIYRGLLLGTGPQVDPGFQGVLSCPLHNLSNNPIMINLGQHLATIDFETTTGLPDAVQRLRIASESKLYNKAEELGITHHVRFFELRKRWLRPVTAYPPGTTPIRSSVGETVRDVVNLRRQLRFGAFAAIIASLAVGAALLGVLAALLIGYWQVASDNVTLHRQLDSAQQSQAQAADKQSTALQAQQNQLHACFAAINAALSSKSPGLTALPPECLGI